MRYNILFVFLKVTVLLSALTQKIFCQGILVALYILSINVSNPSNQNMESSFLSPLEGAITMMWINSNLNIFFYVSLDSPYQYAANFQSDGYIALPKSIFPRR